MIYTVPDYYEQFRCTADKCEDTCCAGWQIVIDKESIEKYKKLKGDYIWKVMACVDWSKGCFRQDQEKRCAFLNKDNLCELYINAGENSLCKTCREYPRHTEEFENVREVTLSVSCPEVARILMERITPVTFLTTEKDEADEVFEDFDPFFFSILEDARRAMISILQDRNLQLEQRSILILAMAHDMQGRINRQELFTCGDVIEKYQSKKALSYVEKYLSNRGSSDALNQKELLQLLYKLELLRLDWGLLLQETEKILFSKEDAFDAMEKEFDVWAGLNQVPIHLEQILVYFLFTYFPGAVYDGNVFAKAQMAVYLTKMVKLLWMARWFRNGKELDKVEMTELLYRLSREVEHSDDNLKKLDTYMKKKWLL